RNGCPSTITANAQNTASVIASCAIFNCDGENPSLNPTRLPGTWKQYSKNAIPQLARITSQIGDRFSTGFFRCQYHANVMNTFEIVSNANGSSRLKAISPSSWYPTVRSEDY